MKNYLLRLKKGEVLLLPCLVFILLFAWSSCKKDTVERNVNQTAGKSKSKVKTCDISNFRFHNYYGEPYPMRAEPLLAEVDPVADVISYKWYIDNSLVATTSEPSLSTYSYPCAGTYHLVEVEAITSTCTTNRIGDNIYPQCSSW